MSFFNNGGSAVRFQTPGDSITGTLSQPYREQQATKFGSQEPDFWPDGSPKMQAVVDLDTTQRDPENPDDDGARVLYVSSPRMRRAIADAIKKAGAKDLEVGGRLTITYTGPDPQSKNPAQPAKLYRAEYAKPTGSLAPKASPWDTALPTAAPATPPASSGITAEQQAKVRQLQQLGLDAASIAAAVSLPVGQIESALAA